MGHTIETSYLPRSYCQIYYRYPRVGILSVNSTVARRIEPTPSHFWSERWPTSFLQHCGRRIHRTLTQLTITCGVYSRRKFTEPIANVDELLIDEWAHFDQPTVDTAINQGRRCLRTCIRAHVDHQF